MEEVKAPSPTLQQQRVQLWQSELVTPLLTSLKIAEGTAEFLYFSNAPSSSYSKDHNPSGLPLYQPSIPTRDGILHCSFCQITFDSRSEQVSHYSLELHRTNIKRVMEGLSALTLDHVENQDDDLIDESLSESDMSTEDEMPDTSFEEESSISKKPWIFFENSDGLIISIFRNILFPKKTVPSNESELTQRAISSARNLYWVIILIGGGHFAAAVFKGSEVIAHRAFHSYTVRSKQGGTQSSNDNKSGTSHPKSAGASMRRYNERSQWQDIQELLETWRTHLNDCDLIFFRCPVQHRSNLFEGQRPFFTRGDFRLRTIPFSTKKATFKEVKRVHCLLAQIVIHAKEDYLKPSTKPHPKKVEPAPKKKSKPIKKLTHRKPHTKLSMSERASDDTSAATTLASSPSSTSCSDDEIELITELRTLGTEHLIKYGCCVENDRGGRHCRRELSVDEIESNKIKTIHNAVYTACRTGNLSLLQDVFDLCKTKDFTSVGDTLNGELLSAIMSYKTQLDLLNIKIGVYEKNLLHVAAENDNRKVLWWLLEAGCDPAVQDNRQRTPYRASASKTTKNHFRKFMSKYPHKFDFEKAEIPSPLTEEQETSIRAKQAKKKKLQKKSKQLKEKSKKMEEEERRVEVAEKERFLKLSDREKRALAAERRVLMTHQQQESNAPPSSVAAQRCFQCALDITGQVPFEYSEFRFCSTKCVKLHRNKPKMT